MDALLYNTLPLVVKSIIIHGAIGYEEKNKKRGDHWGWQDLFYKCNYDSLSVSKTLQPKPASKLLKTGLPPSLFNPDIHINWKKRMSSVISFVP